MLQLKIRNKILSLAKKHFLFLLLIPIVLISQFELLRLHSGFGFSDVDWGFLNFYRKYKELYPNPLINFIETFKHWGVYAHQSYYIGLQGEFFGLNFKSFQETTHFLKALATLAAYPLFFVISGSILVASISVALFAIAYPAVGTMYTVVTSSDYLAAITLPFFLYMYWKSLKAKEQSFKWLTGALFVLLLTLFLSTERIYPILFLIPFIEFGSVILGKSPRRLKNSFKRMFVFYTLPLLVFIYNPGLFLNFFENNGRELANRISSGDWHLVLTPFVSLGSTILPHFYWKYLGAIKLTNFEEYIKSIVENPLLAFIAVTVISGLIAFKKPKRFIFNTLILFSISIIIVYHLATNHVSHFDPAIVAPSLIGFYLIGFCSSSLKQWLDEKDSLQIGLFAGPLLAFAFIFFTWISADTNLVFSGTHRYMTVPAMGMSFFLGSLLFLMARAALKRKGALKLLVLLPLVIFLGLFRISTEAINEFFDFHLRHGFGAKDQQYMRGQLNQQLTSITSEHPSLFYFEWLEDSPNGYYYDATILGGFSAWMLWNEKLNFREELAPVGLFWNQPDKLESAITTKNGKKGFLVNGQFFPPQDFYAFKLKDKKVIDIKGEILTDLGFR